MLSCQYAADSDLFQQKTGFRNLIIYDMANLYSKIHRLKAQGWTWDEFLHQISLIYPPGIDEKTLYGLYRQPHRKASRHIRQVLEQLHDKFFPSPYPASAEVLMAVYNRMVKNPKHPDLGADQQALSEFLDTAQQHGYALYRARLYWLSGNIKLDQLGLLRKNGKHQLLEATREAALNNYRRSLELSLNYDQVDSFTLYKLRQNMLACYLNALTPEQRSQSDSLLNYLHDCDFINASKQVLLDEPYQWLPARNGLRFSSLVENSEDCRWFYAALCSANKAFRDLNYAPENTPAIAVSKEFQWALEQNLLIPDCNQKDN